MDLYDDCVDNDSLEQSAVIAKLAAMDKQLRKLRKKVKKAKKTRKGKKAQPSRWQETFVRSVPGLIDLTAAMIKSK